MSGTESKIARPVTIMQCNPDQDHPRFDGLRIKFEWREGPIKSAPKPGGWAELEDNRLGRTVATAASPAR